MFLRYLFIFAVVVVVICFTYHHHHTLLIIIIKFYLLLLLRLWLLLFNALEVNTTQISAQNIYSKNYKLIIIKIKHDFYLWKKKEGKECFPYLFFYSLLLSHFLLHTGRAIIWFYWINSLFFMWWTLTQCNTIFLLLLLFSRQGNTT